MSGNGVVVEETKDVQRETWPKTPPVSRMWNCLNACWSVNGGSNEGAGDSGDGSASLGPCYKPGHDERNNSPYRIDLSKE